jgi:hypothetical protein
MSKTPNESYKDNLKENTTKSYIESVKKFSSNNDNVTYLISTAISVILFIMMLIVVYTSKNNSNDPIIAIVLVSIFSFLIIYFLFYNYVSEFLKSAQKLKNVSIITIYILCLVFLFTVLSKEYSDQYAHIILPIILSIGFYLFYNAFSVNIDLEKSKDDYSIDFIRINYVLIFLLLFIFMVIMYAANPGGYITSFAWIELMVIFTLTIVTIMYIRDVMKTKSDKDISETNPRESGFLYNLLRILSGVVYTGIVVAVIAMYVQHPSDPVSITCLVLTSITTFSILGFLFYKNFIKYKDPSNAPPVEKSSGMKILGIANIFTIISTIYLFVSSIAFIIPLVFPILLTDNFITDKNVKSSFVFILLILFFIFWLISFIKSLFFNIKTDPNAIKEIQESLTYYNKSLQMIFIVLMAITAIFTLLYLIVSFYQNIMSTSTIGIGLLYLFIFIIVSILIYKLVTKSEVYKESPLFQLVFNSFFYIPCIIVAFFDRIMHNIPKGTSSTASGTTSVASSITSGVTSGISSIKKSASEPTPLSYYIVLIISVLLFIVYFTYPYFTKRFSQQGGMILVNRPIQIKNITSLASYEQLNNSNDTFKYQYGLSFWVYIDSASPSTNKSYETYATILDYGGKPRVSYNASLNTLRITMNISDSSTSEEDISSRFTKRDLDGDGNIIIYEKRDVLLQKWNNIIFNYSGGTLDVFYNGELAKSSIGIIPYMNYDNLVVGQDEGLYGQICNVNYFKDSLNIFQINYLYKSVKDYTPPVLMSDDTILNLDSSVGTGNILGESAIMTDLPNSATDTSGDEKTENDLGELLHTDNAETGYLSLKWYFNANGDKYN